MKLDEQVFSDVLIALVSKLNSAEQPLLCIITIHRQVFLGALPRVQKVYGFFFNFPVTMTPAL